MNSTYNFTDLQQTAENRWQARYHGNYGIYTVKIEFDEYGRRKNFSCTCPSEYYPCKHIEYLQTQIKEQIEKFGNKQKKDELTVEKILQNVPLDELRTFIIKTAKFNNDLTKEIILEFAGKPKATAETENVENVENIYNKLIGDDLWDVEFDRDNYYEYGEEEVDLSILNEWLNRAKGFIEQQKYNDALLVCKAAIEEYAEWYEDTDDDTRNSIYTDYQDDFFELLKGMAKNEQIDKHSLYEYCKQELSEKKYCNGTCNMFNDLMAKSANASDSEDFIAVQKELLKNISNKSSREAEQILQRLYEVYLSNNQENNANELVEQNLHIERFCKIAVEKRIAEKQLNDAKQLIWQFEGTYIHTHKNDWNKYKLDIAQKEKDIPTIRRTAFEFIETNFDNNYFSIYKSAFSNEEWKDEFEKLYAHYDKKNKYSFYESYNQNMLKLLVAENLTERLIAYAETHLSVEMMEKYHTYLAQKEPRKTLALFRKAVDLYAEKNAGEKYYGYVCHCLKQIKQLPNGTAIASEMIDNYRIIYKRRPKMMELLNKI